MASHPLDNMIWNALAGPQAHLGVSNGKARRFDPEISIFAAVERPLESLDGLAEIIPEVINGLRASVHMAERRGVKRESIVIDPGIGFGKSQEQNLELIAKLDQLIAAFPELPLLVGTSRKSFLGRILADEEGTPASADERLHGTIASMVAAVLHGAHIVRVHDVKASVDALKTIDAITQSAPKAVSTTSR